MEANNFKRLAFSKVLTTLTLLSDAPIAIERIYSTLKLHIESCHADAIAILPDLSTLKSYDTFAANMLPLTSYNGYHKALAFFKNLSNHLRFILGNLKFAVKASIAYQGL